MPSLPWFKVDIDLPRNRKSLRLGLLLKDDRSWAYMVQLWCWCAENNPWGRFEGAEGPAILERAAGWTGELGALAAAATTAEFLDRDGDAIVVHDAATRFKAHIKYREAQRSRKRKSRASKRNNSERVTRDRGVTDDGGHTDVTLLDVDVDRDVDRETKDVRTEAESPLVLEFQARLAAGTASTARLPYASKPHEVPEVRAELEGLIRKLGVDEATRVAMNAATDAKRRQARWPSVLKYYVPVLLEAVAARPSAGPQFSTPIERAASADRLTWSEHLTPAEKTKRLEDASAFSRDGLSWSEAEQKADARWREIALARTEARAE